MKTIKISQEIGSVKFTLEFNEEPGKELDIHSDLMAVTEAVFSHQQRLFRADIERKKSMASAEVLISDNRRLHERDSPAPDAVQYIAPLEMDKFSKTKRE